MRPHPQEEALVLDHRRGEGTWSVIEWRLLLNTGFGNVFPLGRWVLESTVLIADAVNDGDWKYVIEYAHDVPWDPEHAN